MDYNALIMQFRENSNGKYDDFNNKIINSNVKTIGCTVPFVRSVSKQFADSLDEVMSLPVHEYYEVDLLRGIVVSLAKLPFEQKCRYLDEFALTIENWAVCDCSVVKVPKSEREQYFAYFCNLCASDKPFVCRYGVVNLMSGFLDEEHVDAVFETLRRISVFGHYYVDMAVAWLLATAITKCRDKTIKYMEGEARSVVNAFAYNKALQKMRDSYRVSEQDKQWSRTLKM